MYQSQITDQHNFLDDCGVHRLTPWTHGLEFNEHKTFRRRPSERLLYVQFTSFFQGLIHVHIVFCKFSHEI